MIVMLIVKLVKMMQEIVNHAQEIEKINQLVHVLMELTTQTKKTAQYVMTIVMDVTQLLMTVFSVPMDMLPHQNVH
jgi:dephospho-CoA kinase